MLQTPRILWGALFASTVIFFVIMLVVHPETSGPPEPIMAPALGFVALTTAVMSFIIPRMNYRQATANVKLDTVEESVDTGSDVLPYRGGAKRRVFTDAKAARKKALMIFQTPFILSLALSESIALYGFVLGFLGFHFLIALPFFIVSWVLIALRFPTEQKVFGQFETGTGAHFPT
jgi:hypothetical protein